ncbi:MAG: TrmO family methyltransferase [Verrucomicrobiales bacterium]
MRPPRLGKPTGRRLGHPVSEPAHSLSLSLVRLLEISTGPLRLEVAGCDMVDGIPVLDIKPYLPWCESIPDARSGWAMAPPALLEESSIQFPLRWPKSLEVAGTPGERFWPCSGDPRPAYLAGKSAPERLYGATVAGWNVRWRRYDDRVEVVEFSRLPEGADP